MSVVTWQMVVAVLAALVILVHAIFVCDVMGPRTSHAIRALYGFVSLSALASALEPLYGKGSPSTADACVLASIAAYLLINRRHRHAMPE